MVILKITMEIKRTGGEMIKGTGLEVKLVVSLYYPNPKDNGNMHTSLTMTAIEYFFCGIQVHMIKSSFSIFWEADTGHN